MQALLPPASWNLPLASIYHQLALQSSYKFKSRPEMSLNTHRDDEKVLRAEGIVAYQFNDRVRLQQALRLAGSFQQDGNKYLALLGDAIIKMVLVKEGVSRQTTRGKR